MTEKFEIRGDLCFLGLSQNSIPCPSPARGSKGVIFGVKNENFQRCPRVIGERLYHDFEWFQPILKGCDAFPWLFGWILSM